MLLAHAPCVRLVPRWRDYSKSYWQLPFRAWYLFMVDSKILRRVRAMLIISFAHKTTRRLLATIVTAWHEFSVHKTVETRSRSQLRVSLKAQEELTAAAEQALDEYAKVLIDAEGSLEAESRVQHTLQRQAEEARTELASLRLKCHSAQQECLRLRTLVRHYELRYPKAFAAAATEVATAGGDEVADPPDASTAAADASTAAADASADAADASADAETPPASQVGPPMPPPLIVSQEEATRLSRLHAAADAMLTTERYLPPESGGTSADHELRRMRALLGVVLTGALPESATLEMQDILEEATMRVGIRSASSEAHVYSSDLESLKAISVPSQLTAGKAGGEHSANGAVQPLLPKPTFGESNMTASELHSVPSISGGDAGADNVARRVRERREALQSKVRARVNLYARDSIVVETVEDAEVAATAATDGAGMLSSALMGL